MEKIDQIIRQAVEPYLGMIEKMQKKQIEKEAEIVVMKYAALEMDRKFNELERKLKALIVSKNGVRGSIAAKMSSTIADRRATGMTSRGNSKAPQINSNLNSTTDGPR